MSTEISHTNPARVFALEVCALGVVITGFLAMLNDDDEADSDTP